MRTVLSQIHRAFSTVIPLRGKSQLTTTNNVKLRGLLIKSTREDSPNLIMVPEVFDRAENWLNFFMEGKGKDILEERNVYIVYPRNFGTSDRCNDISWQEMADDYHRFMYQNKISMATMVGHGLGAKIALAVSCFHFDKVTGYFGINSSPMDQYYHEAAHQLRGYIRSLAGLNLQRSFGAISHDLKKAISCPKWRSVFQSNLVKSSDNGYEWSFHSNYVFNYLQSSSPSSLWSWPTTNGLYPGRANFVFAEHSRFVHLGSNTLPMHNVCPKMRGWNLDITTVQGDESPMNHWPTQLPSLGNSYAYRLTSFLQHYDGVHNLLINRSQVASRQTIPDIPRSRQVMQDYPGDRAPAHYHHNWRFRNVYEKK